jgi:hypothetical protein
MGVQLPRFARNINAKAAVLRKTTQRGAHHTAQPLSTPKDWMLNAHLKWRKTGTCLPILILLLASILNADTTGTDEVGVTIYEHTDFGGDSRVLVSDVRDLSDLEGPCGNGNGNWSGCMSSIQLPSGWTATLYERPDFEGESLAVTSSISNLSHFPGCNADWDNCAQSIRVEQQSIHHDLAGSSETSPLDIPDEAGFFVYSHDRRNALRIFGSFRMLAVLDDTPTFHPYDLVPPKIPTGGDYFPSLDSTWTINMSRFGFDALVGRRSQLFSSALLIRMEVDWKGEEERFRIRHFFVRSKHWLIGKTWSTFNNLAFLPLAVDGRLVGGGAGVRPPQVRHYREGQNWDYQVSVEYRDTSMVKPESLNALSRVVIPDVAGRVGHRTDRSEVAVAGLLRPNRLQFPDHENRVQTLLGYGGLLGFRYRLTDQNRVKLSLSGGTGMGSSLADYAWTDIDVAYDPSTLEFENVNVYTAFLAFEHDWTKELSSTIGGSYLASERKDYFPEDKYIDGYKALVNLFYKRALLNKQFVFGFEVEYAERTNMNDTRNGTARMSVLIYYDF